MNQTNVVENSIIQMGGSGSTNPAYYSSSRSLNYGRATNSLNSAEPINVVAIPYMLKFKDSVGLFGAENIFIKIDLDIKSARSVYSNNPFPQNGYIDVWTSPEDDIVNFYTPAMFDDFADLEPENDYDPARISNDLSQIPDPFIQIDLINLKTGNKFVDNWLDMRIYKPNGIEHPYDRIYLPLKTHFYIGFHARNTRRLPYNINLSIGSNLFSRFQIPESEMKYLVDPRLN